MEKLGINLNNFSWQFNIALMGAVFSVFSLIYNEYYIYYGLITFAFGVFGHIFLLFSNYMFMKDGKESIRPTTWVIVGIAIIFIAGSFGSQLYYSAQEKRIEAERRLKSPLFEQILSATSF